MEKLEVRFKVSYFYNGNEPNPFMAKVTLLIPKKGKFLHESLVAFNVRVFGNTLTYYWGADYDDHRGSSTYLSGNSWEEVKEKVQQLIDETIKQLSDIREKYNEAIRTKPDDETLVVLL